MNLHLYLEHKWFQTAKGESRLGTLCSSPANTLASKKCHLMITIYINSISATFVLSFNQCLTPQLHHYT